MNFLKMKKARARKRNPRKDILKGKMHVYGFYFVIL